MENFRKRLEPLIQLWEEWNEGDDDFRDDNWQSELLSLELAIHEEIESVLSEMKDNPKFPNQIDLNHGNEVLTIIFHLIMSQSSDGLFDKKIVHIDYLDKLLNDNYNNYYGPIGNALVFCEMWIQEIVITRMLASQQEFCVVKAVQLIADSKLIKFRPQCDSLISMIANQGYKEDNKYLLSKLKKAIYSIKAKGSILSLEKLIEDKSLQENHYLWQDTLFSLVGINSNFGWETYKQACIDEIISPESTDIFGFYGKKSTRLFLENQLAETKYVDWKYGYLYALGSLGAAESLDSIIEFINNKDPDLIEASLEAFFTITGSRLDNDLDIDASDCEGKNCKPILKKWLRNNSDRFSPNIRYYQGTPFTLQTIISNLVDYDSGARSSAIESLVTYTNEVIPYNPNGFVSNMISSQKIWQEWYNTNKSNYPDGCWYIDGNRSS